MNANNEMEIMRMGLNKDLDILKPAEQDEILGGKTEIRCQKGYSKFWGSCDCGYAEVVTDDEDEEVPEQP